MGTKILKQKTKNILNNEKGVVLIELAIALPVLLLIILGGIEIGLYFSKKHIVARAVDSVIIPLQLNPSDKKREIESTIRGSGMGMVDFSAGNNSGNYICAKAYQKLEVAQQSTCNAASGWHPEASYWLLNPNKPYYIAIAAHAKYKSFFGVGKFLPDINEWHVFQVTPPTISIPVNTPIPQPTTDEKPPTIAPPMDSNQNYNPNSIDDQELNNALKDLQNTLRNSPIFQQQR